MYIFAHVTALTSYSLGCFNFCSDDSHTHATAPYSAYSLA